MQMMRIRHMRMRMLHGLVPMRVAVRARGHGLVGMQMMAVVMRMGMFVVKLFMLMRVAVRLHQVQHDTHQHQDAACRQHPGA